MLRHGPVSGGLGHPEGTAFAQCENGAVGPPRIVLLSTLAALRPRPTPSAAGLYQKQHAPVRVGLRCFSTDWAPASAVVTPCLRCQVANVAGMQLSYPVPDLSSCDVKLRRWRDRDLSCVRAASKDLRIAAGTTVPARFTEAEGAAFIRRQWQRADHGEGLSMAIAGAADDDAVGLLWLAVRPQPGVLGLGYWIVPEARGRGFGTRAVRLCADWAVARPGIARLEAWVEPDNQPSQRLVVSAGFAREGVLRSFLSFADRRADAIVFSRVRDNN